MNHNDKALYETVFGKHEATAAAVSLATTHAEVMGADSKRRM
jgi:hypothetical protein